MKNLTKFFELQKKLNYDPKEHRYWIGNQEFMPVTKYIKKWIPEFDEDKWSKHTARKTGKPQLQVLSEWAEKAKISGEFGSVVHAYIEAVIKNKLLPKFDSEKMAEYFKSMDYFYKMLNSVYFNLYPEIKLFDEDLKIAGTCDLITEDEDGFDLFDYKTNEKLTFNNVYEKLYNPFSHLDHCKFSAYSLQLNIYKYMFQKMSGHPINNMIIGHILPSNFKLYLVPDLQEKFTKVFKQQLF